MSKSRKESRDWRRNAVFWCDDFLKNTTAEERSGLETGQERLILESNPFRELFHRVKRRAGIVRDFVSLNHFEVIRQQKETRHTVARSLKRILAPEPPRLLLRIDDFPSSHASSSDYLKFHALAVQYQIPYLLGVTPFLERQGMPEGMTPEEKSILESILKSPAEIALHGFTHRRRKPGISSELAEMAEEEMRRKLGESFAFFEEIGETRPEIFIAPFNAYDPRTLELLSRNFKIICGGPESILTLGRRMPSFLFGSYYLPSYRPLYDPLPNEWEQLEKIYAEADGGWLAVTLHWANGVRDDFAFFHKLFTWLSGKAVPWKNLRESLNAFQLSSEGVLK